MTDPKVSTPSTRRDLAALPRLWYDYEVQAWVEHGKYTKCNHTPLQYSGRRCCYAGQHAGETADPSHCLDTEKEVRPT